MFAYSLSNGIVGYLCWFSRAYKLWDDYIEDSAYFFRTFYYALVIQTHTCLRHNPILHQIKATPIPHHYPPLYFSKIGMLPFALNLSQMYEK